MIIKRFIAIILVLILALACVGCSDSGSSSIIYFGVNEPPKTIDPQSAGSVTELMLVKNLYEGLMRKDIEGNIVNGVIENYSKQGDTYTFTIKDNAVWNDGTPLTASDFKFGISRALDPKTHSPNADCLYGIKNAKDIHSGKMNAANLGVTVIDEHTLKIEAEAGADILYALTTAPAMPCNEDFFEKSVGKYGMSFDTVLCNGSYKMRKWATEDFAMRIIKNTNYTGNFVAKNAAVYFSKNKDYTNLECLEKNYVDLAEIPTTDYAKAKDKGYKLTTLNNKILIIGLGPSYTKSMRNALFGSLITKEDFSSFNSSYKYADTLFPEFFGFGDLKDINIYNPQSAKTLYNVEIKKFDNAAFPTDTIYFYGDSDTSDIVKCIAGHWQQNLGTYINIAAAESNGIAKSYAENGYGIGVYFMEINEKNTNQYLENFSFPATLKNDNNNLQNYIFGNSYKIPISFFGSCFAYTDELQNLQIDSIGGSIDFSYIIKK